VPDLLNLNCNCCGCSLLCTPLAFNDITVSASHPLFGTYSKTWSVNWASVGTQAGEATRNRAQSYWYALGPSTIFGGWSLCTYTFLPPQTAYTGIEYGSTSASPVTSTLWAGDLSCKLAQTVAGYGTHRYWTTPCSRYEEGTVVEYERMMFDVVDYRAYMEVFTKISDCTKIYRPWAEISIFQPQSGRERSTVDLYEVDAILGTTHLGTRVRDPISASCSRIPLWSGNLAEYNGSDSASLPVWTVCPVGGGWNRVGTELYLDNGAALGSGFPGLAPLDSATAAFSASTSARTPGVTAGTEGSYTTYRAAYDHTESYSRTPDCTPPNTPLSFSNTFKFFKVAIFDQSETFLPLRNLGDTSGTDDWKCRSAYAPGTFFTSMT
jgi:hypothetical protein